MASIADPASSTRGDLMKCMVCRVGSGFGMQYELLCYIKLVLIQGMIWL